MFKFKPHWNTSIRRQETCILAQTQNTIFEYWDKVTTENLTQYADVDGYWNDFYNLFGFGFDNVDYDADVNPEVNLDLVE